MDGSDLSIIADEFGITDGAPEAPGYADLDNDGDVDDIDIFLFAEDFGRTDCLDVY